MINYHYSVEITYLHTMHFIKNFRFHGNSRESREMYQKFLWFKMGKIREKSETLVGSKSSDSMTVREELHNGQLMNLSKQSNWVVQSLCQSISSSVGRAETFWSTGGLIY